MTIRTYRATVRGRFPTLTADQRTHLLREQSSHTVFDSKFGPEGVFLYEPELLNFQYRRLVETDEDAADEGLELARLEAEEGATKELATRGLSSTTLRCTADCVEDIQASALRRRQR